MDTRVSSGTNAAAEIVLVAEEDEIDMIVKRPGASGRGQWLLGSVTDKIVRASSVPVVVVPT